MTDNLPAFPLDHLALRGAPDAPALRFKDKVYSYQVLNHRIGRLAAILAAQDFTAGDRIATWLPKTELACLMPLAAVRAGLVQEYVMYHEQGVAPTQITVELDTSRLVNQIYMPLAER